jgi:hypothetical protein
VVWNLGGDPPLLRQPGTLTGVDLTKICLANIVKNSQGPAESIVPGPVRPQSEPAAQPVDPQRVRPLFLR